MLAKVGGMKRVTATFVTLAAAISIAQAGPVIVEDKNPIPVDPSCPCFFPGLQVGAFASGYLPNSDGVYGDLEDALGGGVLLSYFFTERIGLEYSYAVHATDSEKHINALDVIYRLPLGNSCWAPYLLGGGAVFSNGDNEGAWRLGGGLEYRLPSCTAIFADATYNWVEDEPDATQVRLGFRLAF